MSQKTNPTLLRLKQTNKDFSYFWYNDYFYGQLNNYSLLLHNYIKQVNAQIAHSQALFFFDIYYKRCFAYMFLLDARGPRERRGLGLGMRPSWLQMTSQKQKNQSLAREVEHKREQNKAVFKGNAEANAAEMCAQEAVQDTSSHAQDVTRAKHVCEITCKEKPRSKQKEKVLLSKILRDSMLKLQLQPSKKKKATSNYTSLSHFVFVSCKSFSIEHPVYSSARHMFNAFCLPPVRASKRLESALTTQQEGLLKQDKPVVATVKDQAACTTRQSYAQNQIVNLSRVMSTCLHAPARSYASLRSSPKSISFGASAIQDKVNHLYDINEFTKVMPLWFNTVSTVCMIEDTQNAHFLAGEIVYLLEKRVSFKKIKDQVLREIVKKDYIKGVRLSCSGRVASRSKKAQKTKTQFLQWGDTSLHVFDSKLSFSYTSAHTAFGKVGVKVWLCYK